MLAATNGRPVAGALSERSFRRPMGVRSSAASDTEDQRKTNWFSARLASAFQIACRTAAHTTSTSAGPLTCRSYPSQAVRTAENPSIDRGLRDQLDSHTYDYRPDTPCEAVRRRVLRGRTFCQG